MYKLAKWAYELGIKHERRRVKLLIREHQNKRPQESDFPEDDKWYKQSLVVWEEVNATLNDITNPTIKRVYEDITPLDED